MATLAVYRGDQFQRRLELGEGTLRIGRGAENGLVLEDPDKGVSRVHAEIRAERGGYVVADLNSQNGIWLRGRRIKVDTLPVDSPLTVGPYRLVLEAPPQVAPAESPAEGTVAIEPDVEAPDRTETPPVLEPVNPSPPSLPGRNWRIVAGLAVAGVVAAGVLIAALRPKPQPPIQTTPVPVTSSTTSSVPTNHETFAAYRAKAKDYIAKGDKDSAAKENAAALALFPNDPEALEQQKAIEAMVVPPSEEPVPPVPVPPAKPPDKVVADSLRVSRKAGESPAARTTREKTARWHLDDGKKAFEGRRYDEAIELLQRAIAVSGQTDFGYSSGEASRLIQEAQAAKAAAEANQKRETVQRLVEDAKGLVGSDVVAAIRKLQEALALDPQAAGATGLLNTLQELAGVQGRKALSSANNNDTFGKTEAAITDVERAIRLLEVTPGASADLAKARNKLQELKRAK